MAIHHARVNIRSARRRIREAIENYLVPHEVRPRGLDDALGWLEALPAIQQESSAPGAKPEAARPIFVLSSGWRTGSTLVQRLIMSGKSTLIWGEPFGEWIPIPRLAAVVSRVRHDHPQTRWSIEDYSGDLTRQFIANLHPGFQELRLAQRAFIDRLLADPARRAGYTTWGAKFVRLTAEYARYLRWLYPDARFVFLVRHPLSAYRSYRPHGGWFSVDPYHRVVSAHHFAAHWDLLASSFVRLHEEFDALLLRYEDLVTDSSLLDRLEEHVGRNIDRSMLDVRVGGSEELRDLRCLERTVIDRMTKRTRLALRYNRAAI